MIELRIETKKINCDGEIAMFMSQPILTPKCLNITLSDRKTPLNINSKGTSQEISALNQALCELGELATNNVICKDNFPELIIIRRNKSRKLSKVALWGIQKLEEKEIKVRY